MTVSYYDLECEKIDAATADLRHRKEAFLRARGWEHTSSTVDCRWRWFKTINGRAYGCDTEDAFSIQSGLDRGDYLREHPEEMED